MALSFRPMNLPPPKPLMTADGFAPASVAWGRPFICRAGVAMMLVAVVVLLGWQFDVVALRSVLPGTNSMKPVTAVTFLLAGLALLNRCSVVPVRGLCRVLAQTATG